MNQAVLSKARNDSSATVKAVDCPCALEHAMADTQLGKVMEKITLIPSQPQIYQKILAILNSPAASIHAIGAVIAEDAAVSVKLLQMVNSAYFGLPRKISDPNEACVYLGVATVKALVLSIGIQNQFDPKIIRRFDLEKIWNYSLQKARLARKIAESENGSKNIADDAYLAGLLHDIGKIIMATNMPDDFQRSLEISQREHIPDMEAELRIFGTTHAHIAASLLRRWEIPAEVMIAICFHHEPSSYPEINLSALTALHIASALIDASSKSGPHRIVLDHDYIEKVGLTKRVEIWQEIYLLQDLELNA